MKEASPVEQVRAGVDIVDLVAQYVSLKKAGRTFKALCPFHTEKTPSFVLFPDTGRWHCFGCGEGGDVFSFLMKIENLSFAEALRRLADRIGVPVSYARESDERREANRRLHAANEAAAVYYHSVLLNSAAGKKIVASRGISEESVRSFLLGLAPDSADAVQRQLLSQGFTPEELLAAGLLYAPEDGPPRDRYRGRLMFPIREVEGHIVSFGARALASDAQPKYLNGPQTTLFDKGMVLFGIHSARDAIRQERRAVVVEGYVDVVIAHQEGFRNVVATLGTSITDRQLRQLARIASEICLALDPDAAGESAALHGAEVARTALADAAVPVPTWRGLVRYEATSRARITSAALPQGKDPDEVILGDPDQWRAAIANARPVVEHALDWVATRHDLSTARGKAEAADVLAPLLRDIADPIQRSHYIELSAQRLGVDSTAVAERVRSEAAKGRALGTSGRRAGPGPGARTPETGRHVPAFRPQSADPRPHPNPPAPPVGGSEEYYAIALLVAAAQRGLPTIDLETTDFADPSARALAMRAAETLRSTGRGEWRPDPLALVTDPWLEEPTARVRQLLRDVEALSDAQVSAAAQSIARQVRSIRLTLELRDLTALLPDMDPDAADQIKAKILEHNRELAALRRTDAEQPRGPSALGRRVAAVPARFRHREFGRPTE
ncbi:MAG: DNA primase [Chloroflexi bacterium]|nr:DNA primase [Chloroflexota bacterium]